MKHTIVQNKALCFGGRAPLFSQRDLFRLVGPLLVEQLLEVNGSQNPAEAAVIYDVENRWAVEDAAGPRNAGVFYKETVEKPYQAFRKLGINVDVIDETCSLDG